MEGFIFGILRYVYIQSNTEAFPVKFFLKVNCLIFSCFYLVKSRVLYLFILSVFVSMNFIGKRKSCYIQLIPDIK